MKEDIKTRLNSIREIAKERRSVLRQVEFLTDKMKTIRDANHEILGYDSHKSNVVSNPTADKAAKIVDEYQQEYNELSLRLAELEEEIKSIKDELDKYLENMVIKQNEFDILNLFYLEGLSLIEVHEAVHYTLEYTQGLKANALKKIHES